MKRSLQPASGLAEWLEGPHISDASQYCATDEALNAKKYEEWNAEKVFTLYPHEKRREQLARLESFRTLQQGWDSYDAAPPGDVAVDNARHVLRVLWTSETAPPLRQISPSVEGGVAFVFTGRDKKYADIECFNNGDILAITSDGSTEPSVWSLNKEGGSIRHAIEKLNAFFNG
jgi:hypothetical protein